MRAEQKWTLLQAVYACLMLTLLLGYFYIMATYVHVDVAGKSYTLPVLIWVMQMVTSVIALSSKRLRKDKGFRILAVYLLIKFLRVVIAQPGDLFISHVSESLLTGVWAVCACYGLRAILGREKLKQFLSIFLCAWTIGMVINSCMAIYAIWREQFIFTIGNGSFWGISGPNADRRLWLAYFPTNSGSVLSFSVLTALGGAWMSRRSGMKVFYILMTLPMVLALCLTDSRTAQITLGVGLAVMAGLLVLRHTTAKTDTRPKGWLKWPAVIAVTGIVFIGTVFICNRAIGVFNSLKSEGLIPRAVAEETKKASIVVSNRGYTGEDMFTGRTEIWKAALQAMRDHPLKLLTGNSIVDPLQDIRILDPYGIGNSLAHCHNMPLEILTESGLPGLFLIGAFLWLFIRRSWKLIVREDAKGRLVPLTALLLSIMAGELVECFTWFRAVDAPTMAVFFIGMGIYLYEDEKITPSVQTT